MSLPRRILPGTTYLITRRCLLRTFLLRPSEDLNKVFLYCLAIAAEKFQIEIHAFCVLSNHYHIIATDTKAQLPAFMHWLNEYVAKCVNALLGRCESVWSQEPYSAVRLETAEDVLDKMVYVYANPVKARLVRDTRDWPGLCSLPEELGGEPLRAIKPLVFFRKGGALPDATTLKLMPPKALSTLSTQELITMLRTRLDDRKNQILEDARQQKQPFLGRRAVLNQSPFAAPAGQGRRGSSPLVACKDKERRQQALQRLKDFVRRYREAWKDFCDNASDVVFPEGTYLLRLRYGVACAADP